MTAGVSSRPSSRRQQTVAGPRAAATSHKYSTISAAALDQLLHSPIRPKSNNIVAAQRPILDQKKFADEQVAVHNVSSIKLPSIVKPNHAESDRDLPRQAEKLRDNADDVALPALPTKHSIRSLTPVGEFLHNKMKSTKGCSMVNEDEAEKRLRQQAILKKQIEEKRRLQELEEQQRQQTILEEEERVKRERVMLQKRWDKELEQERRQSGIQSASEDAVSRREQSLQYIPQDPLPKFQQSVLTSNQNPLLVEKQESIPPTTSPKQASIDSDAVVNEKRVSSERPIDSPSAEHARLQDNLKSLTKLCEKLLQEQKQMKSELESQRRQAMLASQDRKLTESLREQLQALQEQLTLLTPHERAMLRIRAHRRKTELHPATNPQRPNATKSSGAVETKLSKPFSRKRGSWATQSKAMAPAPRESISVIISEGETLPQDDARSSDLELGSVTKFVYPDDSLWELRSCASRMNGEQSVRVRSRGSLMGEQDDTEGASRRSVTCSNPGAVRKPTSRTGRERRNGR